MSAQCELYEDLLVEEALGEIGEKERMFLRRHLDSCGQCRAQLAAISDTINVMKRERVAEAPAGLAERTLHRVERAGERFIAAASPYHETMLLRPSTWRVRRALVGWMVAASVLVMMGAALLPGMLGSGDQRIHACQEHLKIIGMALRQHAWDHNGMFPMWPGWYMALDYEYLRRDGVLLCPGRVAVGRQSDVVTDYIYNPSRVTTNEPVDYPLLWDRRAAHDEAGRNVLYVDGRVNWVNEEAFERLLAKYKIDEVAALR